MPPAALPPVKPHIQCWEKWRYCTPRLKYPPTKQHAVIILFHLSDGEPQYIKQICYMCTLLCSKYNLVCCHTLCDMLQIMYVIMAANTYSTALYNLKRKWCTAACSSLMPHTELSGMVRSVRECWWTTFIPVAWKIFIQSVRHNEDKLCRCSIMLQPHSSHDFAVKAVELATFLLSLHKR